MNIERLVKISRSYRRFDEERPITVAILKRLVSLVRFCPSARNAQALKFMIVSDKEKRVKVFSCLAWAAALRDWSGPKEGERPTGYIIILNDHNISKNILCDDGIAAQTIMLGAAEEGFGGCILHAVNRKKLRDYFNIPAHLEIRLVLALGKPKEKVIIEPMTQDGSVKYWRDEKQNHHVPKRSLAEIIF